MRACNVSALGAWLLLSGCAPAAEPDRIVELSVHTLPHCPLSAQAPIQLEALGDFRASPVTAEFIANSTAKRSLEFPANTLAVTAQTGLGSERSWGVGFLTQGRLDLTLYREKQSCRLWEPQQGQDSPYPKNDQGVALGYLASDNLVLVAGSLSLGGDSARAATVDLSTGQSEEVQGGMLPGRAFAAISTFGKQQLLVSGGVDPNLSGGNLALSPPLATAIVFDTKKRQFDRTSLIPLAQPRARHATIELASGDVLLIGGRGQNNLPTPTLEAVSPEDRSSRVAGLGVLGRARSAPQALKLDNDTIFVGGGYDSLGAPVQMLEWLSPNASKQIRTSSAFLIAKEHAFAAMPRASVLGVGMCQRKDKGCNPSAAASGVVWLRRDGSADTIENLASAPDRLWLVGGNQGFPWLLEQQGATALARRFDPWLGRFLAPEFAPQLDTPLSAITSTGSGAFAWLTPEGNLAGFRHSLRNAFSRSLAPLLLSQPDWVAPDRAALGQKVSGIAYSEKGLELGSDATASVVETTYADFDVSLALSSGRVPYLELGDFKIGSPSCPWPDAQPPATWKVQRRGNSITVSLAGQTVACNFSKERVPLRLSSRGISVVRSLSIRRR